MIYSDYNNLGKKPNLDNYKYHEATHVQRSIPMSDEEKSATPIQPNIIGNISNNKETNKKEDYFFTKSIDYNFDDEDDDDEYYD